jgi:hypothetical protein
MMQPKVSVKLCETLLRRKNSRQRHEAKASRAEEDGVFLVLDACWILRDTAWRLRIERTSPGLSTGGGEAATHCFKPSGRALTARAQWASTL